MEATFDTVKAVAQLSCAGRRNLERTGALVAERKGYGTKGPIWYGTYAVPALGVSVVHKGTGDDGYLMFEGSVPKALGLEGVASAEDVVALVSALGEATRGTLDPARVFLRRVDVCADLTDPDGALRRAAIGWRPHPRSRYVQAVYEDTETVWLHNKSRGVRVYDKFAECAQPWAAGLTRVEYQVRKDWAERYGLVKCEAEALAANGGAILAPLVDELRARGSEIDRGDGGLVK